MDTRIVVDSEVVPIDAVKPHPRNPRRNTLDLIRESLQAFGQYRPIVVQRSTGHILAGNHTWKAARSLNWATIAVCYIDCDDETAQRVLIADNRASDLASYDNDALATLLRSLPSLDATGFSRADLDDLENLFGGTGGMGGGNGLAPKKVKADIALGPYEMWLDADALEAWRPTVTQESKSATAKHLRTLLGFPLPRPPKKREKAPEYFLAAVTTESLDSVHPYEGNAREGDIGAISESLREFGQFRPIVVNRPNRAILVGNHTWRAAKYLGWKQIAVAWVDVDDETATRIVLMDNRSADLATYDDDALLSVLTAVPLTGTGFIDDDIDDLLNDVATGRRHKKPAGSADIRCRVDEWSWSVDRDAFDEWDSHDDQYEFIIRTLGLPADCWTTEAPQ